MRAKLAFELTFLLVGFLTVLEFVALRGQFAWVVMVGATVIFGLINICCCAGTGVAAGTSTTC